MKNVTSEQLFIASSPATDHVMTPFIDAVMSRIQRDAPLHRQFPKPLRRKKQSLLQRLRHMPAFALFAIVLLALVAVSGTAYAVIQLWPKPHVELKPAVKNQFGRSQVIASFDNCSDQPKNSTFEIKKGSTLDPKELPQVLQARCEKKEIEKWANDNKLTSTGLDRHMRGSTGITKEGDIEDWGQVSSVASKVVSITPSALSLTGDEYNSPKEPLVLTSATKFIVNGNEAKREDIKPGDAVLFIKWDKRQYKFSSTPVQAEPVLLGQLIESKVTYVIKVDLPFEYYGPTKQNQIIEREACYGNPDDTCINGGGVDLYENLNANKERSDKIVSGEIVTRHLQAVIQAHAGNVITVKSSSGRVFTLTLPTDILAGFNRTRSAGYGNIKIGVGDTLTIDYQEKANEHTTSLGADKITNVDFAIDFIQKSDPVKKY